MKQVIIVDDHPIFLQGLKALIEATGRYRVCNEASSISDFRALLKNSNDSLSKTLFILDISLPDGNGFDLLPVIVKHGGQLNNCTMLSMHNDLEYVEHAISKGASGYLVKNDSASEIIDCLRFLEQGKQYISKGIERHNNKDDYRCMDNLNDLSDIEQRRPDFSLLSKRELEILKLVAHEKSSQEISEHLSLSRRTVENHRANICSKLGIKGSHGLITLAVKNIKVIEILG